MGRESVSACGDALARQIMLFGKPKSDEALLAAIDQVDGQSVSEMAGKLIDTGSPSLAYVGPLSDLMENDDLEARLKC